MADQLDFTWQAASVADKAITGAMFSLKEWQRTSLRSAIEVCARQHPQFTAEDVVWKLSPEMREIIAQHPNVLGAAIRSAAQAKIISATGQFRGAAHAAAHGRQIRIWRRYTT